MNYRLIARILGYLALVIALFMLTPIPWALYFGEYLAVRAFLASASFSALAGACFLWIGWRAKPIVMQREALAGVGLGWLFASVLGGLPFLFGNVLGPVDAFFEGASGFTTTGATVLSDIEAAPKSALFWRSLMQWIGGGGIIVLFLAVLPYLGAGGKQMFKSEVTGPDPRALQPRIKDSAILIYKIYLTLTVIQTGAYMIAGLDFYNALCHTLSGLSTGGFSPQQASVAAFDSLSVEIITIVFMILGGTSFALYFAVLRGHWLAPFRDTEWRFYIGILAGFTLLIAVSLMTGPSRFAETMETAEAAHEPYGAGEALRAAGFQVVSIMTSTGYATDDYDGWPAASRMLMVLLMFIGGCAGSTSGGAKVVRIVLLFKMVFHRLERTFRPKTIRAVRLSGEVVEEEALQTVYGFLGLYFIATVLGCVFLSALGLPFETAVSACFATISNIGPGLEIVGPAQDFSTIPAPGKVMLTLYMVLGRLELFSIAVFLIPSFWRVR